VADYDAAAARQRRSERQRDARRARRRRGLLVGIAVLALVGVAAAAPAGWRLVSREIARRALKPAAVQLAVSVPATVNVAPIVAATRDDTLTVTAVGDLLFDLSPRTLVAKEGGRAPLVKVETVLADSDVTIGNLEGPLSNRGVHVGGKLPEHIFEGDPRSIESLKASGFDLLALANNHVMDHGPDAVEDTLKTLGDAGIASAGAGMNSAQAWKPAIIERKGKKIAFLSFSQIVPGGFLPTATHAGLADGKDMKRVLAAIREAKKQADYVIVSYHWGVEQSWVANAGQIRDARASIDAGADMVLSHHPHVMQGLEFYKGKLIAYSLGNFLFPYKTVEGRKSFILKAELGPSGAANVRAIPVYMGEYGRPSIQTGASAAGILGKLREVSAARGAKVVIEGDTARVVPQ
jgi:hypothetical protein